MAKIIKELYFSTPNRPGELFKVAKAFGKARINILDMCSCEQGRKRCEVCLNTSNNLKAWSILRELGYRPHVTQAIAFNLPNRAGRLAPVLQRLARRHINIKECEFTTAGNRVEVVLSTNKNKKAARIL